MCPVFRVQFEPWEESVGKWSSERFFQRLLFRLGFGEPKEIQREKVRIVLPLPRAEVSDIANTIINFPFPGRVLAELPSYTRGILEYK